MFDKLESLAQRLEALDRMLMDPEVVSQSGRVRELSREHSHLTGIVDAYRQLQSTLAQLSSSREMLGDSDPDVREMAKEEVAELEQRSLLETQELKIRLLPPDPYEGRPILLEIRAGTGGDEAGLFAGDLYRMYQRFGERHGLRFDVMSSSPLNVGGSGKSQGFKEIIASITGEAAYRMLRFESGVHRVQRIPVTEAQGRIHTSTATVAVLPEPDEVEVRIDAKDLRIDTMRAGGPGGQSVNTTDSAVRIVHIPTGLIVQCQDEKSQLKNKDKAMRVLKARLLEMEQTKQKAEETAARRAQVGTGDRSERIRTYNFPQNRMTDHRIGLTLYKLDQVMEGDIQELIDSLISHNQAELLADQDVN